MDAGFENLSVEELVRQSQAGSLTAFEQLVFRYEARVLGFVARCCHSDEAAREVTQDTFIRAFQALTQFNPDRAFAPWLFTIARHKCVDYYRRRPKRADEPMPDLADHDSPAVLVERREERSNLWRTAREQLPEVQFQALWLRYAEEMDLDQIGQVLGKTRTGVKVLLFRARQTLGRALARENSQRSSTPPRHRKAGLPAQRLSPT
jgi:RNA polymerase sigma-70 factor (ECF subfamily)